MTVEIDSYADNWKKTDTSDKVFYARRSIMGRIIILLLTFIIYTVIALVKGTPIPYGMSILCVIIALLLRWSHKYVIVGATFITFCGKSSKTNKCILLKNIIDIKEQDNTLIVSYRSQDTKLSSNQLIIKLDKMLTKDRQEMLKQIELVLASK